MLPEWQIPQNCGRVGGTEPRSFTSSCLPSPLFGRLRNDRVAVAALDFFWVRKKKTLLLSVGPWHRP